MGIKEYKVLGSKITKDYQITFKYLLSSLVSGVDWERLIFVCKDSTPCSTKLFPPSFRVHISTFRAENTPRSRPLKAEKNAQTLPNSKTTLKKFRNQLF